MVAEIRAAADARAFLGVAEREVCGTCRYRSICPESAAPGVPTWPTPPDADLVDDRVGRRAVGCRADASGPPHTGAGRSRPDPAAGRRPHRRARADRSARRRGARRGHRQRRAALAARVDRHGRGRRHAQLELPGPRRAARPPARRIAPPDDHHDGRRQFAADDDEPARGRDRPGRSRRRPARWRRVRLHAVAGPAGRAEGLARLDPARRSAVPRGVGRRPPGIEPVRDGAPRDRADPGVPVVRDRAARRRGSRHRRAPAAHRRAVVGLRRGRRGEPARVDRARRTPPTEIRTVVADEPHGDVPVLEADVRQHRRRPGGRAAALLVRHRPRRRRARRPAGVPTLRSRRARPLLLHRAGDARRGAGDRDRGARRRSAAAGTELDDVARFDLYSCFPAAVELALQSLGLARARRRRRPAAHRHRRARLRGRAGEQLLDARHRRDGRSLPARSRLGRARHRARLVRDEALGRALLHGAARATGFVAVDPAATQATVDALPRSRARGAWSTARRWSRQRR